jgi:hypothetical protein
MKSYKQPTSIIMKDLTQEQINIGNLETKKQIIAHLVGLVAAGKIVCPDGTSVAKHLTAEAELLYNFLEYKPSNIARIN